MATKEDLRKGLEAAIEDGDEELARAIYAQMQGPGASTPAGWKPPGPEEMDTLLAQRQEDSRRAELGPVRQPETAPLLPAALRLAGHGLSLSTLPTAAAALTATFPGMDRDLAGSGQTWGERFRHSKGILEGNLAASRRAFPTLGPTLETAGGLGTGLIGKAAAPISALVDRGPMLYRALAALADSMWINGAATGVSRMGDSPNYSADFAHGAREGITSPANVIAPGLVGAGEAAAPLARYLGRKAATKAVQAMDPLSAAVTAIREQFSPRGMYGTLGIQHAGDILLDLKMSDGTPVVKAGDTAFEIANKLAVLREEVMAGKGDLTRQLTDRGVKVDALELLTKFEEAFHDTLGTKEARVPEQNRSPREESASTLRNAWDQYGPHARPTSTNVTFPDQQLPLPFSVAERPVPVGTTFGPETRIPAGEPVQTGLGLPEVGPPQPVGYTRAPEQITLVLDANGNPTISQRGAVGAEAQPGTPGKLIAPGTERQIQIFPEVSPEMAPFQGAEAQERGLDLMPEPTGARVVEVPGQMPERLVPGTTRPAPGTGHYALTQTTPGEVTSVEIGRQGSLFTGYDIPPAPTPETVIPGDPMATELARQLRSGHTEPLPPRPPPEATSTNIEWVNDIPLADAERLKTAFGDVIHRVKSPYGRDRRAIAADPNLRMLDKWRGILAESDRAVVDSLSPEDGAAFRDANTRASMLADLSDVAGQGAAKLEEHTARPPDTHGLSWAGRHLGWALPALTGGGAGFYGSGWQGAAAGAAAGVAGGVLGPKLVPRAATQARAYRGAQNMVDRFVPQYQLNADELSAIISSLRGWKDSREGSP